VKRVVGLVVLVVWLVPVWLYGQGYMSFRYEREQILSRVKFKIGPFRFYPLFQLRDIGYDDNVYYQREEPVADYTGTLSPQIKAYFLFRNILILSFTENPEYVYYLKQKRERRWNNIFYPEFKLLFLHRFVISGRYSYSNRRRRATSEFDVRANEKRQSYGSSIFYETARSTSFGFSFSSQKISYEDIAMPGEEIYLSRLLNRREKEANLELYYGVFSESFFFIRAGYKIYNFEHPDYHWRDAYSYQGYAGLRFPLLGRIRGAISLGYKNLIPRTKYKRGFSGFVGSLSLDYRVGRFFFRLRYNRDCYFSYWTNNIFFLEDRYGLGVSFYLTTFLRLDYDFSYARSLYPETMLFRDPETRVYKEVKRRDLYRTHTAGIVFRIIRNTGLGIRVSYWERDSNIYWVSRDRMIIGGFVTYEF